MAPSLSVRENLFLNPAMAGIGPLRPIRPAAERAARAPCCNACRCARPTPNGRS